MVKPAQLIAILVGFVRLAFAITLPVTDKVGVRGADAQQELDFGNNAQLTTRQITHDGFNYKLIQPQIGSLPEHWCALASHTDAGSGLSVFGIFDSYGNVIGFNPGVYLPNDQWWALESQLPDPVILQLHNNGYSGIEFWYAGHSTSTPHCSNAQPGFPNPACLVAFQCNGFGQKRAVDDVAVPLGVREGDFNDVASLHPERNPAAIAELSPSDFTDLPTAVADIGHAIHQNHTGLFRRQFNFELLYLIGLPAGWCSFSTHADPDNHLITWSVYDSYGNNIGPEHQSWSLDGDGARYDFPMYSQLPHVTVSSATNWGSNVWIWYWGRQWSRNGCGDMQPGFPNPACVFPFQCVV